MEESKREDEAVLIMEESEHEDEALSEEKDDNLIFINSGGGGGGKDGHEITFDINTKIPILSVSDMTTESIGIIKSTINMLYDQIYFLKEEIREKNLLIKTLNFRNANNGEKIYMDLLETSTSSNNSIDENIRRNSQRHTIHNDTENTNSNYTRTNIVGYDTTTESDNNTLANAIIKESIDKQLKEYKHIQNEHF